MDVGNGTESDCRFFFLFYFFRDARPDFSLTTAVSYRSRPCRSLHYEQVSAVGRFCSSADWA